MLYGFIGLALLAQLPDIAASLFLGTKAARRCARRHRPKGPDRAGAMAHAQYRLDRCLYDQVLFYLLRAAVDMSAFIYFIEGHFRLHVVGRVAAQSGFGRDGELQALAPLSPPGAG